jgi:hypothetical protein
VASEPANRLAADGHARRAGLPAFRERAVGEVIFYICNNCYQPIEPKGSEVGDGLAYHRGCYYLTTQPGERAWLQMQAEKAKGAK